MLQTISVMSELLPAKPAREETKSPVNGIHVVLENARAVEGSVAFITYV